MAEYVLIMLMCDAIGGQLTCDFVQVGNASTWQECLEQKQSHLAEAQQTRAIHIDSGSLQCVVIRGRSAK